MGRSAKDGRPVAGPATGDALKSALKDALGAKNDGSYQGGYQTKTPQPAAPTSPPSGDLAAGLAKLTHPRSNIEQGLAKAGE
jgi:hypothetical protein